MVPKFPIRPLYAGPKLSSGYVIHGGMGVGQPVSGLLNSNTHGGMSNQHPLGGQITEGQFLNANEQTQFQEFKRQQQEKMNQDSRPKAFSDLFGTKPG